MTDVKSKVLRTNNKKIIAAGVVWASLMIGFPTFIMINDDVAHGGLKMESTPCTLGENISEWLGSEAAFIDYGMKSFRKHEYKIDSSLSWYEGGILSQRGVFTSTQHRLINTEQASKAYRQCSEFLSVHHGDRKFSKSEVSDYLSSIISRASEAGNTGRVTGSMLTSMSDFLLRGYSENINSDFELWFKYGLINQKKSLEEKSILLEDFTRGTELSTMIGALSAVLAFSNSSSITDVEFDVVERLSNDYKKFKTYSNLNPTSVVRGFEHSVKYIEYIVGNSGRELNEADARYLVASILGQLARSENMYSNSVLVDEWISAWQKKYPSDNLSVRGTVVELSPTIFSPYPFSSYGADEEFKKSHEALGFDSVRLRDVKEAVSLALESKIVESKALRKVLQKAEAHVAE